MVIIHLKLSSFTEYRQVEHGGTSGHISYLAMLPDAGVGIFFTCNFGKHYLEREMISMFLLDILLDGESFMDAEYVCEFLDDVGNGMVKDPSMQVIKGKAYFE